MAQQVLGRFRPEAPALTRWREAAAEQAHAHQKLRWAAQRLRGDTLLRGWQQWCARIGARRAVSDAMGATLARWTNQATLTRSLTRLLARSLTHSLAQSLTHSLTHSLARSLTHSLARSLTLTPTLTRRWGGRGTAGRQAASARVARAPWRCAGRRRGWRVASGRGRPTRRYASCSGALSRTGRVACYAGSSAPGAAASGGTATVAAGGID